MLSSLLHHHSQAQRRQHTNYAKKLHTRNPHIPIVTKIDQGTERESLITADD